MVSAGGASAEADARNVAAALRNYNLKNPTKTPLDIFEVVEPQVFQACRDSALRNDTVPHDAPLRRVEEVDANGLKIVKFIGQRSFVHDFTRAGRRVTSFLTPHGRVNAAGQPVR